MTDYYNHYDCKYWKGFDDNDYYCTFNKKFIFDDDKCCEHYDEKENALYPRKVKE